MMTGPAGGTEPSEGTEPTEGRLVVPRGGNRGLLVAVVVVVAVVVLAVLKPWGAPGDSGPADDTELAPSAPGDARVSPAPSPKATPPRLGVPGGQCFPSTDWRVYAFEVDDAHRLQHWLIIEPGAAAGPRDPSIPVVRVVTDRLLGLGFCVGSGPDGLPPLAGVRAWALAPATASSSRDVPVDLVPLAAYMPHDPDLGATYLPPAGSGGAATQGWSPGRYVFAVGQGNAEGDERWFGVEIATPPREPTTP